MTTEPKFVPNNAAEIQFDDGFSAKVRLIDACVIIGLNCKKPLNKGYLV